MKPRNAPLAPVVQRTEPRRPPPHSRTAIHARVSTDAYVGAHTPAPSSLARRKRRAPAARGSPAAPSSTTGSTTSSSGSLVPRPMAEPRPRRRRPPRAPRGAPGPARHQRPARPRRPPPAPRAPPPPAPRCPAPRPAPARGKERGAGGRPLGTLWSPRQPWRASRPPQGSVPGGESAVLCPAQQVGSESGRRAAQGWPSPKGTERGWRWVVS